MTPEVLLAALVHAHRQAPEEPRTPFLLQTNNHASAPLLHPMLPDGDILADQSCRDALRTLVQWGYLEQTTEDRGQGYVLTPAGLDYAARLEGSLWDGTERRQQARRAGRMEAIDDEERRHKH